MNDQRYKPRPRCASPAELCAAITTALRAELTARFKNNEQWNTEREAEIGHVSVTLIQGQQPIIGKRQVIQISVPNDDGVYGELLNAIGNCDASSTLMVGLACKQYEHYEATFSTHTLADLFKVLNDKSVISLGAPIPANQLLGKGR